MFPALSEGADAPAIDVDGERRDALPEQAAPPNSPVSVDPVREAASSDVELLTRLEQLAAEAVKAQKSQQSRAGSSAGFPPGLAEPRGELHGERGISALAQRLEDLHRTVLDLAATVSSQEARRRTEGQFHITRSDERSGAPPAFWERNRLGRGLRTGR